MLCFHHKEKSLMVLGLDLLVYLLYIISTYKSSVVKKVSYRLVWLAEIDALNLGFKDKLIFTK